MPTETTARTPVRRLATYYAADLREGDRIRHHDCTYVLAGTRVVASCGRGPVSARIRIGLDLDDPEPPAQTAWGLPPARGRILTVWARPDETFDVEEDHQ